MIRIVVENLFFFLLPTLFYITWIAFKSNTWPGLGSILKDAPLVTLFALGVLLMLMTLAVLSSREGNRPGDAYQPPIFKDGHIEPGHRTSPPS
ncbi:MAG: hypothetical protein K2X41_10955 [Hyphomicrobium sp.]|nr:hypothetical protein [Hyphomicrobium sp.]